MIEQALIFALGFLLCALLSLLILPAFWRRALRLSTRRLEMLMPLSISEVHAQRDQLRAQAAVAQRRLEQKLEAMTRDRARHMGEIGRNAGAIAGLEAGIRELAATLGDREGELRGAWAELGALHVATHDLERRLDEAQDARRLEAQDARAQIEGLRKQFDFLRIEKAALDLQVESLMAQERELRAQLIATERQLAETRQRAELSAMMERRGDELAAAAALITANELNEPLTAKRTRPDHQSLAN